MSHALRLFSTAAINRRPVAPALLGLLILTVWTHVAAAQDADQTPLAAAGNGQDLFIAERLDKDRFRILTHSLGDPDGRLRPTGELRGRLAPGGLTASDNALWVIYADGTVQSIALAHRSEDYPGATRLRLGQPRTWPDLPVGAQPRAFAASSAGLWVLVHMQDRAALERLDAPQDGDASDQQTPPPPREHPTPPTQGDDATSTQQTPTNAKKNETIDEPRLLFLARNRWEPRPLPDNWTAASRAWMVMPASEAARPWLVAHDPAAEQLLWWTALGDSAWSSPFVIEHAAQLELTMTAVQGQLVTAQRLRDQPASQISLSVVRPRSATAMGVLKFDIEREPARWWLVAFNQAASVVLADAAGNRFVGALDLQGREIMAPTLMATAPPSPWVGVEYLILVLVLAATTVSVVVFSRRDPEGNRLELRGHMQLAPLPLRMAAGIFDLVPAVILSAWLLDVEYDAVWASSTDATDPAQLWPLLTSTGLFVLYTTIAEATTATTLGKAIFRLSVATMRGERPSFWQILARNLMKACDLMVLPLLIVALLSPYRQRFGDLLARTVVVMSQPDESDTRHESDDSRRPDSHDDEGR